MPFGTTELLIVLAILLLLFGASKLPKLARSVGESAGELKKGMEKGMSDDKKASADRDSNKA